MRLPLPPPRVLHSMIAQARKVPTSRLLFYILCWLLRREYTIGSGIVQGRSLSLCAAPISFIVEEPVPDVEECGLARKGTHIVPALLQAVCWRCGSSEHTPIRLCLGYIGGFIDVMRCRYMIVE